MTLRWRLVAAVLVALGVVLVPEVLPEGPSSGLDASRWLSGGNFAVAAAVIFVGGLLTALTPCVYPLIPITVGVFGAHRAKSRGHALALTSAYVVGMGVVFSSLGTLAALSGKAFGSSLSSPVVAIGLSLFMLVLASSMFGAFELALPPSLATRLSTVGGGGLWGAFLMGSVSGFLAAPCTGPVLTGVLTFVATAQSPSLGAGLLFVYALGVGVPFLLIGAFTVRLPKGGAWMEWVKSVVGVALVALAASYLRDAFPALRSAASSAMAGIGSDTGVLLAGALTLLSLLLGVVDRSFKDGMKSAALKGLGVFLFSSAILIRAEARDVVDPGQAVRWALTVPQAQRGADQAPGDFEAALASARSSGQPVMIDFFAEWCEACKELDRNVYVSPDVVGEARRFVAIKVDGTDDHPFVEKLYARFGVPGLPTVAFIDSSGQLLTDPKVTGYVGPEDFLAVLRRVQ